MNINISGSFFKPVQAIKPDIISFKGSNFLLKNNYLVKDTFTPSVVSFKSKAVNKDHLSQNLLDYPVNQFYVLLLDSDFMNGKGRHNNFGSVHEDEDIFFQWFSEIKSRGILKNKLPKIEIDGPTGCRTIWRAMNDKEKAHELIPLYILATDWYYNNDNIDHPRMVKSVVQLAISRLESDMKVDLSEYKDKDFHYKEYIDKKKQTQAK